MAGRRVVTGTAAQVGAGQAKAGNQGLLKTEPGH
jgi:hypothetical protein